VHVHDPGEPISYAIRLGAALDDIVVENMQLQYQQYVEERRSRESQPVEGVAVIAVARGDGLRRLFVDQLGAACIVSGGQTMNPSTEDLLEALEALPNEEIILLPNNPNVILAAEQAAALASDKRVRVVPTRSIPQGIAAMVEYSSARRSQHYEALITAMETARAAVRSCEITRATRDAAVSGVSVVAGQIIGLIDDALVAAGHEMHAVVRQVLRKAGADKYELITVYYGDEISRAEADTLAEALADDFSGQQIEVVEGGQPLYPYVIGVE
jgi:dihydroxyacetone kinase-like predicted kinase